MKTPRERSKGKGKNPSSSWRKGLIAVLFGGLLVAGLYGPRRSGSFTLRSKSEGQYSLINDAGAYSARPTGSLTFCRDIAPIVWRRCAPCHRPDQAAPFSLLNYSDVKKRARQIKEVTLKRVMPPWLPDVNETPFEGERRLSNEELGMLQQWIAEGALEGNPLNLPKQPQWPDGWSPGKPDLVITMPKSYTLAAEGRDIYRNFVIPIPTTERHFIRAVEFRPENQRIVHHAFMYIDPTGQSRRLAAKEAEPGFPGLRLPEGVSMPEGQFLTYQPGKTVSTAPDTLAWILEKGNDMVLQVHMNPTGKPETFQASVGFYFTDRPPENKLFKMVLNSLAIDIPRGESNYILTETFTLPVNVDVIGVLPHAHYLARDIQAFASLPDGTTRPLIHIRDWDFSWQGDYRFAESPALPKGSTLVMRYTYDNSTNNVRNPNTTPREVTYGPQSSDEMGELWFQMRVHDPADLTPLRRAYALKMQEVMAERGQYLLKKNPNDPEGHYCLGMLFAEQGKLPKAKQEIEATLAIKRDYPDAHFNLGVIWLQERHLDEAEKEFRSAIQLDPENNKAQGSLGTVFLEEGRMEEAATQFQIALRLNPADSIARENLDLIQKTIRTPSPETPSSFN